MRRKESGRASMLVHIYKITRPSPCPPCYRRRDLIFTVSLPSPNPRPSPCSPQQRNENTASANLISFPGSATKHTQSQLLVASPHEGTQHIYLPCSPPLSSSPPLRTPGFTHFFFSPTTSSTVLTSNPLNFRSINASSSLPPLSERTSSLLSFPGRASSSAFVRWAERIGPSPLLCKPIGQKRVRESVVVLSQRWRKKMGRNGWGTKRAGRTSSAPPLRVLQRPRTA